MELSPLARNVISRATALVVGLFLLRGSWYFIDGLVQSSREAQAQRDMHPQSSRPTNRGVDRLVVFCVVLGLPGFAFLFFTLVPTRALYALPLVSPPSQPEADLSTLSWLEWWTL